MGVVSTIISILGIFLFIYGIGYSVLFSDLEKENLKTIKEFNKLNNQSNFKQQPLTRNDSMNYIDSAMFLSMNNE